MHSFHSPGRRRRSPGAAMAALALCALFAPLPAARADYTATVTPAWDTSWKGWGCSLAWWAKGVGDKPQADTYADVLFGDGGTVTYSGRTVTLPGLRLNAIRYNIGGGGPGNTLHNKTPDYKDIEGFWQTPRGSWDPATADWNWQVDAAQRAMMGKARDRGANVVQFFSDSPMWWMTRSGSTNGAKTRGENLNPDAFPWFSHYLVQVVKHARSHWGVDVASVEALNEPSAYWWNIADGSAQEGATFSPASQAGIIRRLRADLTAHGLGGVAVAASDENDPGTAKNTWNRFPPAVKDSVGIVTAHSYYGLQPYRDNAGRAALRAAIGDRELWMTEYGDSDGSGQALATTITTDLHYLRPRVWCYWQPIEPFSTWGLLNADYGTGATTWVYTKYYVFATFTRYVRPSTYLFRSTDHNSIFAYDNATKKLTIVTVNYENAQSVTYDLSAFARIGGSISGVKTTFDGSSQLAPSYARALNAAETSGRRFAVAYPANCVSVIELTAHL